MTWGEFCTWLYGFNLSQYDVKADLLRLIAFQQLSLSPDVKKTDKPYTIVDYLRFPTDPKPKPIEIPDIDKLVKVWQIKK